MQSRSKPGLPAIRFVFALAWCVALLLAGSRASAEPEVKRFALIVGSTRSPIEGGTPLQFSDDDAVNLFELLRAAGVDARLLVQPDEETKQLHPGIDFLSVAAPTHSNVTHALRKLAAQAMNAKLAQPETRVEVYFGFSGHGGNGALVLHDPRSLTGATLREALLSPTRGTDSRPGVDAVHLIIDACGVASDAEAGSFADSLKLSENPHAGLLLAMTSEGQTLEWDMIGSGVFSYELRSGLLGSADLAKPNDRGALAGGSAEPSNSVEYRELGAFVSAANEAVPEKGARLYPAEHPPGSNLDVSLLSWDSAGLGTSYAELLFPPERELWVRVSDATVESSIPGKLPRRLLLAELHLGPRQLKATVLRLPRRDRYHVQMVDAHGGQGETREFEPGRDGAAADVTKLPVVPGTRGNLAVALKDGLFHARYDESSLAKYNPLAIPGHPELQYIGPKGPPRRAQQADEAGNAWPEVLCIATGVAASFTAVARVASSSSYHSWQHATNEADYDRLESQTSRWDWLTTVGLGATAAAGAGCAGTLLHAWVVKPTPVAVGTSGVGGGLRLRF